MSTEQLAPLTGRTHELKTDAHVFSEVVAGRKLFEIRKDDRGYQCGDLLRLRSTRCTGAEMAAGQPLIYTGEEITVRVIGILRGPVYGLADGWVIMSIAADRARREVEAVGWVSRDALNWLNAPGRTPGAGITTKLHKSEHEDADCPVYLHPATDASQAEQAAMKGDAS